MDLWLQVRVGAASLRWYLLALSGGVAILLAVWCDGSSSSHSLRNFHMAVSEPDLGLPQFIAVGYVDDQPIVHYDSDTRRIMPIAPWMRKVEQGNSKYWDDESQSLQRTEKKFREILAALMAHFHHNSSTGLHTLQCVFSCEVWPDRRLRGGSWKYAYDGKDLLALNMETLTWTVSTSQAKNLKLNTLLGNPQQHKDNLDGSCMDLLRKYLVDYGNETLQRTEPPTVKVVRKKVDDGLETLFCQVYGFYPKEINVTWLKDGKPDNLTGCVLPNSDGTYYTSHSIKVEPKERGRYRCWVKHSNLPGPLGMAWEEPASNLGITLGIPGSILVLVVLVVAGVTFYIKKRQPEGGNASTSRDSDKVSYCSAKGDSGHASCYSGYGHSEQELDSLSYGDSDQEPDKCSSGDSGQESVFLEHGDSNQVFYHSRDGRQQPGVPLLHHMDLHVCRSASLPTLHRPV